ncbi:carbohydrate kinase [Paucilactobacillus hokkaidonensis JCM 18461]|uniref:ADP-dependent (S)-NAD(P)H-hydrate dehydratase n=2 Tax=Paucilactobacillus hokkaidonensis TaxID=1193095 RepID=A0A0A1GSU8_9LACO|nr:NAD(P)H-hydrate dehydratase [Paucilactobacillus hokkaidonensis]KRO10121.1 carbohydrate kinase [Paucilactobacillus hokkaidonensis]BAP85367.1 carbohydrate kinase [Paucilactobacillus hokkaidonensis JCM 18461]
MKRLDATILNIIKQRPEDSFKGNFGKVVLIGGNANFGGAIIMAATATVYSGAGLVTTATDTSNSFSLHAQLPETMFVNYYDKVQLSHLVSEATVVVVGPGLGDDFHSQEVLATVFANTSANQTVVIDGSAITMMTAKQIAQPAGNIIFTPHQMEWQRLSGIKIADQNVAANQAVQAQLNATVVLKKHHTEIYTADETYQLPIGTPAQATGGMGDTLAGMIGGFTAQFSDSIQATLAAVYAHSAIAEKLAETQYVVLPHQISQSLPKFMKQSVNNRG